MNLERDAQPIRVGVCVLILNDKKELLLGYRLKNPGGNSWSPPGGALEFGEDFEICAIRETQEETNLVIESPTFVCVDNHIMSDSPHQIVLLHMKASYLGGQKIINREPTKAREWRWFSYDNLPEDLTPSLVHLKSNGILKKVME